MRTLTLLLITALSISCTAQTDDSQIQINNDIQLIHLQDSIFIHVTWEDSEQYGRFPSNGMIIIKDGEGIMIDTPMDDEKTKVLTEYVERNFKVKFTKLIIGHYHSDCMGGINYIHKRGIKSICGSPTYKKCKAYKLTMPVQSFKKYLQIDLNGLILECRYLGGGHTEDNIVVYIPEKKILFGGCLIKSANSKGLGNTADADIGQWDITVQKVIDTYGSCKTVIPGHGKYGGPELLSHTVKLVKEYKQNN